MALQQQLIVNADDFGLSSGVNHGILQAHEQGIVTSASLMVRWPAAIEAADCSQMHLRLSLGLHVDLGEWVYRDEAWVPLYQVVPLEDATAVAVEVARQLDSFRRLVGRDPTHIDSHQHVHRREPLRSVLVEVSRSLGVPLRLFSHEVRHCGDFYGQTAYGEPLPSALTVDALITILAALPTGITELGCHPGIDDDLDTMYRSERAQEVSVLCDPRVRTAIAARSIALRSFGDIGRLLNTAKP